MSARRDLRLLVHLADERADLRLGEFADAVAEDALVFGEDGERGSAVGRLLGHGELLHEGRPGGRRRAAAPVRSGTWAAKRRCYHWPFSSRALRGSRIHMRAHSRTVTLALILTAAVAGGSHGLY